ncbi:hypothetical protein CJU89_2395 [Yarrowia sp. B02]|nr:hypothetical protein CJU89_2395 [Yarrowia sp. B02]
MSTDEILRNFRRFEQQRLQRATEAGSRDLPGQQRPKIGSTPWYTIPLSRRSAVLMLLFEVANPDKPAGKELHILFTVRSAHLRSFPGQVALPGGKLDLELDGSNVSHIEADLWENVDGALSSDTEKELVKSASFSAWSIALREAYEEVGLFGEFVNEDTRSILMNPVGAEGSQKPAFLQHNPLLTIEKLCELPPFVSRNGLGVAPCIAFARSTQRGHFLKYSEICPQLNFDEVQAVFSIPLDYFLSKHTSDGVELYNCYPRAAWGNTGVDWIMHSFNHNALPYPNVQGGNTKGRVTIDDLLAEASAPQVQPGELTQVGQKMRSREDILSESGPEPDPASFHKNVVASVDLLPPIWGLTGHICIDCARVGLARDPTEFDFVADIGQDTLVGQLIKDGLFNPRPKKNHSRV